jgi:surface polysaccharide O-acyltransferase-like enzyme
MGQRRPSDPGVNAFRFVNMFAVVMAHAWWFAGPVPHGDPRYLLLITAQCSVPTFFITSGYLLRWEDGDPFAVTLWALRKLLPLYVIWGAFYTLAAWLAGMGRFVDLIERVGMVATSVHLWFLPALAFALSVVSLSLRFFGARRTWILAGLLATAGLLNGTYEMFLGFGGHSMRASVATAPLLVLLGVYIRKTDLPRWPLLFGAAVLLTYYLQVRDDALIAAAPGYALGKPAAVTLATIAYGLSVFLFARSLPRTRPLEWLANRKHYLLVIYCIHPMILVAIGTVWHRHGMGSVLLTTTVAYALSTLVAVAFAAAHRGVREFARAHRELALARGAALPQG